MITKLIYLAGFVLQSAKTKAQLRNAHEITSTTSLSLCPSSALWQQLRSLLCAHYHALNTNINTAPVAERIPCAFLSYSISAWALGLLSICLNLVSPAAVADPNWYQIELIVFEQQAPHTELFEQTDSAIAWPKKRVPLAPALAPLSTLLKSPVSNTRIQNTDLLLKNIYQQLRRKIAYKPLLHIAWLQSIAKNKLGDAVHLTKQTGRNDFVLNGFVRLQRGHYLHLLLDMEYVPLSANARQENLLADALIYHLQEKRRIKLNEVHYLDHPKFGVIATVKPIKLDEIAQ